MDESDQLHWSVKQGCASTPCSGTSGRGRQLHGKSIKKRGLILVLSGSRASRFESEILLAAGPAGLCATAPAGKHLRQMEHTNGEEYPGKI